jgi:hypothetical protein
LNNHAKMVLILIFLKKKNKMVVLCGRGSI